jgi:hypothetical protein
VVEPHHVLRRGASVATLGPKWELPAGFPVRGWHWSCMPASWPPGHALGHARVAPRACRNAMRGHASWGVGARHHTLAGVDARHSAPCGGTGYILGGVFCVLFIQRGREKSAKGAYLEITFSGTGASADACAAAHLVAGRRGALAGAGGGGGGAVGLVVEPELDVVLEDLCRELRLLRRGTCARVSPPAGCSTRISPARCSSGQRRNRSMKARIRML